MEKTWSTEVLGNNGNAYKIMLISTPVIPSATLAFIWYVLFGNNQPLPIVLIVLVISGILLYQFYEVLKFLRLASRTVRTLQIKDNLEILIKVFPNREISFKKGNYVFFVDSERKLIPRNEKLFPTDSKHGVLTIDGRMYYISGTTENVEEMYDLLIMGTALFNQE